MTVRSRAVLFAFISSILISVEALANFESVRFQAEFRQGLQAPIDLDIASDGRLFVLDSKSFKVSSYSPSGVLESQFGGKKDFKKPVALALSPLGAVIVADSRANQVRVFTPEGVLRTYFGGSGSGPGQFKSIADIVVDRFGFVYVADAGNRTLSKFTDQGVLLEVHAIPNAEPLSLSTDPQGRVYLLSKTAPHILRVSPGGESVVTKLNFKAKIGGSGGLYVDNRGDIHVSRVGKNNIQKYDQSGQLLASFGSRGKGPGAFAAPTRLAGDDRGNVYVLDTRNKRVQQFSLEGNSRPAIATPTRSTATVSLEGIERLNAIVSDLSLDGATEQLRLFGDTGRVLQKGIETTVRGKPGKRSGEFKSPRGAALLPDGRIVIADTGNHRFQILGAGGSSTQVGERGKEPGFFNSPDDVAVNSKGMIYVSDTRNARVQIFTDQGIFVHSFGSAGKAAKGKAMAADQFAGPTAVAVGVDDTVHVLDPPSGRLLSFNSQGQPLDQLGGFNDAVDMTVDAIGNRYVADNACACVKIFDRAGKRLLRIGSAASGPGNLTDISAIAVRDDQLLVATAAAHSSDPFTRSLVVGASSGKKSAGGLKTFRLELEGLEAYSRRRLTHSFYLPASAAQNEDLIQRYRDLALEEFAAQLAEAEGRASAVVLRALTIESESKHEGGEIRMVLSLPNVIEGSASKADELVPGSDSQTTDDEADVELAF